MSAGRDHSFNHGNDYSTGFRNTNTSDYTPGHIQLYSGKVEKPDLREFLDNYDFDTELRGQDLEEPEIHVDWYSSEENGDTGRLETVIRRSYVPERIPERWAETVPKIPIAGDLLYSETEEYEEVEDVGWNEAVESLEEAGIKPAESDL